MNKTKNSELDHARLLWFSAQRLTGKQYNDACILERKIESANTDVEKQVAYSNAASAFSSLMIFCLIEASKALAYVVLCENVLSDEHKCSNYSDAYMQLIRGTLKGARKRANKCQADVVTNTNKSGNYLLFAMGKYVIEPSKKNDEQ
jgi:hypothetical protein